MRGDHQDHHGHAAARPHRPADRPLRAADVLRVRALQLPPDAAAPQVPRVHVQVPVRRGDGGVRRARRMVQEARPAHIPAPLPLPRQRHRRAHAPVHQDADTQQARHEEADQLQLQSAQHRGGFSFFSFDIHQNKQK